MEKRTGLILIGMVICTIFAVAGIVMMNWSVPTSPEQTDPPAYPNTTGMSWVESARAIERWQTAVEEYQAEQDKYASELETYGIARSLGQWVLWPSLLALIWLSAILSIGRKNDTSP
jgi:hypothetical protein